MGLENYEVFLLQTQIASTCCWGIGLCFCNQFPLYVKFDSFFFHDPNILAEFVAFFLFMFLKLEMCAVNLVLKALLFKPMYVTCLSLSLLVTIAW